MITLLINHLPGSFAYLFGLEIVCFDVLYYVCFDGPLAILELEIMNISGELEFNKPYFRHPFLLPIFLPHQVALLSSV